jgi:hypothetical protein
LSETTQAPPPAPVPPAAVELIPGAEPHTGFLERVLHPGEARHAAAETARVAPVVAAAVRDHASTVFDVAGDVLAVVKLVDPGNTAAIGAAEALLPKVLAMTTSAAGLVAAAHTPA